MTLLRRPHLFSAHARAHLARVQAGGHGLSVGAVFVAGILISWALTAALHLHGVPALLVEFLLSIPPAVAALLILDAREERGGFLHDVRQARSLLASAELWRSTPSPGRRLLIRAMCRVLRVPAHPFAEDEGKEQGGP